MLDLTKILKVGDRVYSLLHGDGEVVGWTLQPLSIKFGDCVLSYLTDGRFDKKHAEPVLFPSKEQRDWEVFIKERQEAGKPKVGDLVLAWDKTIEFDTGLAALGVVIEANSRATNPYTLHTMATYTYAKKVTWEEAKEYFERHCKA